jgi:hypothetical protein
MREAKTKTCKRAVDQGTSAFSNRRRPMNGPGGGGDSEHLAGAGAPPFPCGCCDAGVPIGLGRAVEPGGSPPKPKIRPSIACLRACVPPHKLHSFSVDMNVSKIVSMTHDDSMRMMENENRSYTISFFSSYQTAVLRLPLGRVEQEMLF